MPHLPEPNAALLESIVLQWQFKTPAMRAMTLAVCRLALERAARGDAAPTEFSANDLPEFNHGGAGIAGAIFHTLANRGVLSPVGDFVNGRFTPRYVANPGGNPVRLWRLKSGALARRLIEVHGPTVAQPVQAEMALATNS